MDAIPHTGMNGRPVAVSPRARKAHTQIDDESPGGGVLSSLFCGGGDHNFLICDASPRSNEVDFDVNPTGLYYAIHTKQFNLAFERVKVYPREASTWVVRYGNPEVPDAGCTAGSGSSDRAERIASAAFPRPTTESPPPPPSLPSLGGGSKILRWRMLPIHAAILFGAPVDVIRALLKAHPMGGSAQDDQGMLPLHLAFRYGSSEAIVLTLLDIHPEAIERVDHKGRLPSMLAPRTTLDYGDTISEAFIKGPAYYYWASRVAGADRLRSETAMAKQIKQLQEGARAADIKSKEELGELEKRLGGDIDVLSAENVELKERLAWYNAKYDGAEEKEKVLVDHTNSLAERLRLTSLSEEHLATKLAKLEARLQNKETELDQARRSAGDERGVMRARIRELEQMLAKAERRAESLTESLEKKVMESNEGKVRFEKERNLFEKQIDASKECLMELITSSKEDKRMFEEDSKELRKQLQSLQLDMQKASVNDKRMLDEDSQELRRQLAAIQQEVQKATAASSSNNAARALEDRLDILQREVEKNTGSFAAQASVEAEGKHNTQYSTTRKIEERLDGLQREVASARSFMASRVSNQAELTRQHEDGEVGGVKTQVELRKKHGVVRYSDSSPSPGANFERTPSFSSSLDARVLRSPSLSSRASVERVEHVIRTSKARPIEPVPPPPPEASFHEEEPFDSYISTKVSSKSMTSSADQTRDETECFSHQSDMDTAMALGELSEEQRVALEQLDLGGTKEEIAAMLARVPGLTENQVSLLVDVASSLTA